MAGEKEKRSAEEFIAEAKKFFDTYRKEIGQSIREDKKVIIIDFNDLASFSHKLAEELINSPEEIIQILETALDELGLIKGARVRFIELPDTQKTKIGHIRAKHLNKFICVEGIVRQASDVRPQVVNAKFECPSCGTIISVLQIEKKFREPTRCSCGRKGLFRLLSKEMVDAQRLIIEESPESLMGGEQPRRLSVFLQEDLVEPKMEEKTTPGSRVQILGVLKEIPVPLQTGSISTRFDHAVEANNIIPLEETYEEVKISEEDERQIQELAADPMVFEKLAASIAPSIWGYEEIKKALVLQMFGGVRKIVTDRSVKRGEIHILLCGDPGCLVGDERIILGNGSIIKMKDLGEEHLQKINIQVLTGEGGKKRDYAKIFHAYKNQPIIEIITESGKSIKGTYNHPLLSISNKNGKLIREWKMLKELKIGDRLAVTTSIPCTITKEISTNFKIFPRKFGPKFKAKIPKYVNLELASLLGYMLGDGWSCKYKIGFVVAEPEKDILNFLNNACVNLFGIFPRMEKRKLQVGRTVKLYYMTIDSEDIASCLDFLREKRIPKLIFRSGNKIVSAFLRWLFEADGSVFNKGRGRRAITLKSKNIELLRDVQILLLRFSIHSRIIENSLVIRRGNEIIKFAEHIGFASAKKKAILTKLASDARLFKRFKSQRSERIAKIIFHEKPEDVYDIEIPKAHRFIANSIISHNTAKSQVLKFISTLAPKGRYVVGKSASGAGMTATVVRDEYLKGWALEAGAMVLANKGIVCLDEIEKMDPNDRSAMHEALEQQCVTISKANIQASLQAQTSVLAAGNPKLGRFEPYQTIAQQIDLPPTLINRFDVIFVLRDMPDKFKDESIASHVLNIYQKKEGMIQIERDLFRKYVAYAKQKIKPILSDEAVKEIKDFYVKMRNMPVTADEMGNKSIPISARQLEALVRLSEAHAKLRMSKKVTKEDAKIAIDIIKFYLMQVGFDEQTKTFDIDRIAVGVSSSQRSKVILLRETITRMEERLGKFIPQEELSKELQGKMTQDEIDDALQKLKASGDIFEPRKGFVQKV